MDGSGPIFAGPVFPVVFITISLRCRLGLSRHGGLGYDPRAARQRCARLAGGLWGHDYGVSCGLMALMAGSMLDPGTLLRHHQPGRPDRHDHWRLGLPGEHRAMADLTHDMGGPCSFSAPVTRRRWRSAWPASSAVLSARACMHCGFTSSSWSKPLLEGALAASCSKTYWGLYGNRWADAVGCCSVQRDGRGLGLFLRMGVVDPNSGVSILWPPSRCRSPLASSSSPGGCGRYG